MEQAIKIVDLVKSYNNHVAVNKLNLEVEKGTIHGFLGPNGAGKTTTIKILMGLLWPDAGSAFILGDEIRRGYRTRLKVGYMPEIPKFPEKLKAWELLDIYGQLYGIPRDARKPHIDELLSMVGLEKDRDKHIGEYSKGMRQKLGIAQSLIADPDLIILDEPNAGLDPISRVEIREVIRKMSREGTTIFISSHLLEEVEQVCSHVSIIDEGVLIASGPIESLSQKLKHTVIVVEVFEVPERLKAALEALPAVESVAITGTILEIVMHNGDIEGRREISRCIVASGGEILSMQKEHMPLEDLFLSLVSQGKKSEEVIQ